MQGCRRAFSSISSSGCSDSRNGVRTTNDTSVALSIAAFWQASVARAVSCHPVPRGACAIRGRPRRVQDVRASRECRGPDRGTRKADESAAAIGGTRLRVTPSTHRFRLQRQCSRRGSASSGRDQTNGASSRRDGTHSVTRCRSARAAAASWHRPRSTGMRLATGGQPPRSVRDRGGASGKNAECSREGRPTGSAPASARGCVGRGSRRRAVQRRRAARTPSLTEPCVASVCHAEPSSRFRTPATSVSAVSGTQARKA